MADKKKGINKSEFSMSFVFKILMIILWLIVLDFVFTKEDPMFQVEIHVDQIQNRNTRAFISFVLLQLELVFFYIKCDFLDAAISMFVFS